MAGAKQRGMVARHKPGGARNRGRSLRLSQRRQRERRGRVTEEQAHMRSTVPMAGVLVYATTSAHAAVQCTLGSRLLGAHEPGPRRDDVEPEGDALPAVGGGAKRSLAAAERGRSA